MVRHADKHREQGEAAKYDRRADEILHRESAGKLLVDAVHWRKIGEAKWPRGPYVESIRALGDLSGKRVLELGCGTGWLSVILCKLGAEVDGIDVSPRLVEIARERAKVNGIEGQVRFEVMSAHELSYPGETFDRVYGLSLLHHVNVDQCVAQVNRVLKPGGKAVFSEPVINSRFAEAVRKRIPVPIDDDEEFPAPPLSDRDIARVVNQFDRSRVVYDRFFSSLDRVIDKEWPIRVLRALDFLVLRAWPFRKLARQAVMELYK